MCHDNNKIQRACMGWKCFGFFFSNFVRIWFWQSFTDRLSVFVLFLFNAASMRADSQTDHVRTEGRLISQSADINYWCSHIIDVNSTTDLFCSLCQCNQSQFKCLCVLLDVEALIQNHLVMFLLVHLI